MNGVEMNQELEEHLELGGGVTGRVNAGLSLAEAVLIRAILLKAINEIDSILNRTHECEPQIDSAGFLIQALNVNTVV